MRYISPDQIKDLIKSSNFTHQQMQENKKQFQRRTEIKRTKSNEIEIHKGKLGGGITENVGGGNETLILEKKSYDVPQKLCVCFGFAVREITMTKP